MIRNISYRTSSSKLLESHSLLDFFQKLFKYFEENNIDPEMYCNAEIPVVISWDDGSVDENDICDFIVSAYESMVVWHDGKRGYELLSLLSQHYKPSPLGESDPNVLQIMSEIFDRHFSHVGVC